MDDQPRRRRVAVYVLIVLASVIGFVSLFAIWAKRQALETDTWVETSTELLEDEDIQVAVSDFLVTQLFDNVDVTAQLQQALPPRLQPLAGPATGALRQLADRVALRALQQPRVQGLWEDANRTMHEQLLAVVDDESEALSTTGGKVVLDLTVVLGQIAAQVGISQSLIDRIPPDAAQIEIMDADQLEAAQDGVHLFRTVGYVAVALTLVLYALAVYLAAGWRREALRSVGIAFIVVGALVLFAHGLAGNAVVDALTGTAAVEPAADATWTIATSLLTENAQAIVAYGIVIVLAAWFAGPSGIATSIRRGLTPYLRQPRFAFGGLALLLALLFWWHPTQATERLAPSLVLVVLSVIGVEVLRRQVIAEFPDRVTTWSAQGVAQGMAGRMRAARERRVSRPPAEEDRVAALERLARLRDSGVLSPEEFEAEKRRLLNSGE
jgi:Short C-terminal domain